MAICLGAICLDEPAKMHMAKTVGHHRFVLVGEAPIMGTRRGEPLASRMGKDSAARQTDNEGEITQQRLEPQIDK